MTALTWEMSGCGECPLSLQGAQQLAVEAGFTFKGSAEGMPLVRRADLQAMFDHFKVNSLSSFRQKFWTYELRPHATATAKQPSQASPPDAVPLALTAAAAATAGFKHSATSSGRSRWGVQQSGDETYVGELLDGKRHGGGMLLTKVERSCLLHVGRFTDGMRNGPGVVASSRGEGYEGFFMDDVMWGPGQYTYALPAGSSTTEGAANGSCGMGGTESTAAAGPASPAPHQGPMTGSSGSSTSADGSSGAARAAPATAAGAAGACSAQQPAPPHRVVFHGMMNGRPRGKGCLTWSDGRRQVGQFDGNNCYLKHSNAEVSGVLMVAIDNADEARAAAAEVQAAAAKQQAHVAGEAQRLLASLVQQPADAEAASGAEAPASGQ